MSSGNVRWVLITQLFFGIGWGRAAVEKLIAADWWSGDVILDFIAMHQPVAWATPFVDLLVVPWPALIAVVVLALQLIAAATLLTGRRVALGLAVGTAMNLAFLSAGAVNPSAFYLAGQGALALWMIEAAHGARLRRETLTALSCAGAAVMGFNLPLVSTVDPHAVIDDPAAMLVTVGALTAIAAHAELFRRREQVATDRLPPLT